MEAAIKPRELSVARCEWDDNFIEIADRSGNMIWVHKKDLIVLQSIIATYTHLRSLSAQIAPEPCKCHGEIWCEDDK